MRVFILNNDLHNYAKAEKYGPFVNVTEGKMPIFKTSQVKAILKERLKDFKEEDFLLISGPAILVIIATQLLFLKYDMVKFLLFDAKEQDYVVRHLTND